MPNRAAIAATLTTLILAPASADDLRAGTSATVNADTVWFQSAEHLAGWQTLRAVGNMAALATYEDELLSERDAWRFTNPLDVKILSLDPATHQANVEMTTPGRMLGTEWFIDDGALKE